MKKLFKIKFHIIWWVYSVSTPSWGLTQCYFLPLFLELRAEPDINKIVIKNKQFQYGREKYDAVDEVIQQWLITII